jgi:CheY-like chemotaxis protein
VLRIIYIDDNLLNLRVTSALLEASGMNLCCADSASAGLDLLQQQPFHIVLLDIHMPETSGVEVLAKLRSGDGPNRAIPVIAVTADVTRDERQYRQLGFDGFVPKPVLLRSLLSAIHSALAARAGSRTAAGAPTALAS